MMEKYIGLLDKKLLEDNINPFDLSEYDMWVNDISRRDINDIIDEYDVFGLKIWDYKIIDKDELRDICNFGVDLIFLEDDRDKVLKIINKYKNGEIDDREYVNILFDLSFYIPTWV